MQAAETIEIVQGQDKTFFLDLYYPDTGEPFDLTHASQIEARFPKAGGGSVSEWLNTTNTNLAIVGALGAGKISLTVPAADTAQLNAPGNKDLLQDLQILVTLTVSMVSTVVIFVAEDLLDIAPQPYPGS